MSDLPESWAEVPIGTIARIVGGGTPPSKDPKNFAVPGQGIPWLTPADLSGYRKQTIERGARDLTDVGIAACGATLMPKGTVLFSSRAPIGYVAIAANDISTNQGFKSFILPLGIDPRFTYYQLKWLKPQAEAIATGTTFKELSGAATATLPFKVAPAVEQTRIANQLDTLLTRVQACNDRFDAIPALLNRFRQTVLDAALNGGFSTEMASLSSRKSYPKVRLSEVAVSRLGKMLDKQKNSGTPTPYIGNINVRWFSFDLENLQFISIEGREKAGLEIRDGDVFICEGGEPGRCAIWNSGPTNVVFQKALHRVRPVKERLLSQWLAYCIRHMTDTEQLKPLYTGTTIRHLTGASLSQVLLPLPSVEEQTKIVRRVEALFALADRIEARCTTARAQAHRLTPLVLAKAFRGKLVPQDPNDEPASALLTRITEQRATPAEKSQTKKPRQFSTPRATKEATAMTKSRQDVNVKNKPYLADHLRRLGSSTTAEELFKASELPVADFYKQLAWEVAQCHIADGGTTLEARHAAG